MLFYQTTDPLKWSWQQITMQRYYFFLKSQIYVSSFHAFRIKNPFFPTDIACYSNDL